MAVQIKQITKKSDVLRFVKFGNEFYEGCENFCPALILDELDTFNVKKNPAFDVCEHVLFLAYQGNKIVGRIAGIINYEANKKWGVNKVRFGWMDFIDDMEVSKALLDAVADWGKSKGMETLNGPVGFTDMDHQGLLLEGFEYESPMAALYNYPYYIEHFDAYGLEKEADWIEIRCVVPEKAPEKMARIGEMIQSRYNVKIVPIKNSKELLKRYGYTFFDVIDEAYKPLYNYSPLTEKQKEYYSKMYFPLLNFDFVTLVVNEADEIVAVGVCMPNLTPALRKAKGKLFPFGWYHLLKGLKAKKMEALDLLLIAVRPDYQNKGLNSLLFIDQIPRYHKYGIKEARVTAVLETNTKNQANFQYLEHGFYKRRRAYIKNL